MAKTPEPIEGLKQYIEEIAAPGRPESPSIGLRDPTFRTNPEQANKLEVALTEFGVAAAQAEQADFGATISAIKDATRALKRTVKRAETLPREYERVEIRQLRGPVLEFTARSLASHSHETKGRERLRIDMEIWETQGGAMVAVSSAEPLDREGYSDTRATVVPSGDDQAMRFAVMSHFDWADGARRMVRDLGWALRQEIE